MENYFAQLLSRNAPVPSDLLQPDSLAASQSAGDPEESFVEEPAVVYATTAKAEDMLQPVVSGFVNDSRPYIEQKNIHHHYLQQYFTRVSSDDEESQISPSSILKQDEKRQSDTEPASTELNPAYSNKPETQHALQILSAREVPPGKDLADPVTLPLLSPDSIPKAAALIPAVWLSPPAPALTVAPLQTPSANKPVPSLIIGKILIELLPAKPVPPRIINRSSPFQGTVSKSNFSTVAFGLGQL